MAQKYGYRTLTFRLSEQYENDVILINKLLSVSANERGRLIKDALYEKYIYNQPAAPSDAIGNNNQSPGLERTLQTLLDKFSQLEKKVSVQNSIIDALQSGQKSQKREKLTKAETQEPVKEEIEPEPEIPMAAPEDDDNMMKVSAQAMAFLQSGGYM